MLRAILICLIGLIPMTAPAETRLLMAEEPGCVWCERWNKEIGPIYPKTTEGDIAPLQRYDILSPPVGVELTRRVVFTPTFILVRDGQELGRIEGYPGEDFFWGLLGQLMEQSGIDTEETG